MEQLVHLLVNARFVSLTRDDCLHLHHPILVSWPHTSQPGGVVRVEIQITGAHCDIHLSQELGKGRVWREPSERGIRAGGVAVPEIEQDIGKRLTGGHVQNTDVQPKRNPRLVLGHVLAESLRARPYVGPLCDLGGQHTGVVLDLVVIWSLCGDLVR